jgi:hypothetical protein
VTTCSASTLALTITLGLAASAAMAAPPAATPEDGVRLGAGDTVAFDLGALPERFEGEAKATCLGTRIAATGPVEARCTRPVRFEVPSGDAKMTFVFKGAGGREQRIELPVTRAKKPVTFVAPSAGTLLGPLPTVFPPETPERAARAAAEPQCSGCRGSGFRLQSVEVTRQPLPPGGGSLPVRLAITPAAPPPGGASPPK